MIHVVDYGMGNLLSVCNAFKKLSSEVTLCKNPQQLASAQRIVLPGVGAFPDCMHNLHQRDFVNALQQAVLEEKKPILGICLGMQIMASEGHEGKPVKGLGWFDAVVERLQPSDASFRVPHIGWNNVSWDRKTPVFDDLPASPDFYFVHSYHMRCKRVVDRVASCEHGMRITAAVAKNNIVATQFHPEKSQAHGLKILENFLNWDPR